METPPPAAEAEYRAARIQSALLLVALGMLGMSVVYCFLPRPRLQFLLSAGGIVLLFSRAWARRSNSISAGEGSAASNASAQPT